MTTGRLVRLSGADDLTRASGDHPFLRHDLAAHFDDPALHLDGTTTVAWSQVWADGRRGVVVLGDDRDVAELANRSDLVEWVGERAPDHVTAPIGGYPAVAAALGLRGGNAWDRMWTTTPPPQIAAESLVEWSDVPVAELTEFVHAHNPRPHALPGQHEAQRWVVLREQWRLLGVGCTEPGNTEVPLIGGIAVDTRERGRGLGAAVTAYLTRDGLERTGACTLGVYDTNDHARTLYERLGYAVSLHARTGFRPRR